MSKNFNLNFAISYLGSIIAFIMAAAFPEHPERYPNIKGYPCPAANPQQEASGVANFVGPNGEIVLYVSVPSFASENVNACIDCPLKQIREMLHEGKVQRGHMIGPIRCTRRDLPPHDVLIQVA